MFSPVEYAKVQRSLSAHNNTMHSINNSINTTPSETGFSDLTFEIEKTLNTSSENQITYEASNNSQFGITSSRSNSLYSHFGLTPVTNNSGNYSDSEITPARRNLNMSFENESTPENETNIARTRTRTNINNYGRSIVVEWDYQHPCSYCSCLYLKTVKNRKFCCNNRQFLTINTTSTRLNPLPPQIKILCIERTPHFSRNSVLYNNILALKATGVANGTENSG